MVWIQPHDSKQMASKRLERLYQHSNSWWHTVRTVPFALPVGTPSHTKHMTKLQTVQSSWFFRFFFFFLGGGRDSWEKNLHCNCKMKIKEHRKIGKINIPYHNIITNDCMSGAPNGSCILKDSATARLPNKNQKNWEMPLCYKTSSLCAVFWKNQIFGISLMLFSELCKFFCLFVFYIIKWSIIFKHLFSFIAEELHRMVKVGRDLWQSLGITPFSGKPRGGCPRPCQMAFEDGSGRLHNLSERSGTVFCQEHTKDLLPDV